MVNSQGHPVHYPPWKSADQIPSLVMPPIHVTLLSRQLVFYISSLVIYLKSRVCHHTFFTMPLSLPVYPLLYAVIPQGWRKVPGFILVPHHLFSTTHQLLLVPHQLVREDHAKILDVPAYLRVVPRLSMKAPLPVRGNHNRLRGNHNFMRVDPRKKLAV